MAATVVIGRIEEALRGVLQLSAPGVQDNVYALDIGTLTNPPASDHPVWRIKVLIDDRFEGVDYGADSIIELSKGPDVVYARGGVDLIKSGLGDDAVYAGANDDVVFAGGGADLVRGSWGEDWISGGWHDDLLFGDQDDDLMLGNRGQDQLRGGPGDDSLSGQLGADLALGGGGDDELHGGRGDDELHGGPDADVMFGGAGDDALYGGIGNDTLVGGAGADAFRLLLSDLDRVLDFRLEDGDTLFVDHVQVDDPLAWLNERGEVHAPEPEVPDAETPEEPQPEEPDEEGPQGEDPEGEDPEGDPVGAPEDEEPDTSGEEEPEALLDDGHAESATLDLASLLDDAAWLFAEDGREREDAPAVEAPVLVMAAAPEPVLDVPEAIASDGATS